MRVDRREICHLPGDGPPLVVPPGAVDEQHGGGVALLAEPQPADQSQRGLVGRRLEELGYVQRAGDDADRRRKLARLTPRGVEVLALSAMIFDDIRSRWADTLGADRLAGLEAGLRTMVPGEKFRLDVPGWFGG